MLENEVVHLIVSRRVGSGRGKPEYLDRAVVTSGRKVLIGGVKSDSFHVARMV